MFEKISKLLRTFFSNFKIGNQITYNAAGTKARESRKTDNTSGYA